MAGSSDDARTDEDLISNMEREIVRLRAELDRTRRVAQEFSELEEELSDVRAELVGTRAELDRHRVAGDAMADDILHIDSDDPNANEWRSVRGDAPAAPGGHPDPPTDPGELCGCGHPHPDPMGGCWTDGCDCASFGWPDTLAPAAAPTDGQAPADEPEHVVTAHWDAMGGEVLSRTCSCGEEWTRDEETCPEDERRPDDRCDADACRHARDQHRQGSCSAFRCGCPAFVEVPEDDEPEAPADDTAAPDRPTLRCDRCGRTAGPDFPPMGEPVVYFVRDGLCHPCSQADDTAAPDGPGWRVGRKVGRTVYDATDQLIGVMDTPALALRVVEAVNGCLTEDSAKVRADRDELLAERGRIQQRHDDLVAELRRIIAALERRLAGQPVRDSQDGGA